MADEDFININYVLVNKLNQTLNECCDLNTIFKFVAATNTGLKLTLPLFHITHSIYLFIKFIRVALVNKIMF